MAAAITGLPLSVRLVTEFLGTILKRLPRAERTLSEIFPGP
jgi:hypothetical protein